MVCYSVYRRIISVLLSIEIIVDPFISIEDKTIWCRDFIASSEMLTFPFITGSAVSFPLQKSWSTDHTFRCLALTAGLLSRSADGSPDASSSRVWQVEPRRYAGRRRSQVNERIPHSCATFPHITSHCQLHASTHAHSRRRHLIVVPVSWYRHCCDEPGRVFAFQGYVYNTIRRLSHASGSSWTLWKTKVLRKWYA